MFVAGTSFQCVTLIDSQVWGTEVGHKLGGDWEGGGGVSDENDIISLRGLHVAAGVSSKIMWKFELQVAVLYESLRIYRLRRLNFRYSFVSRYNCNKDTTSYDGLVTHMSRLPSPLDPTGLLETLSCYRSEWCVNEVVGVWRDSHNFLQNSLIPRI